MTTKLQKSYDYITKQMHVWATMTIGTAVVYWAQYPQGEVSIGVLIGSYVSVGVFAYYWMQLIGMKLIVIVKAYLR